jgi:hypothetical protein
LVTAGPGAGGTIQLNSQCRPTREGLNAAIPTRSALGLADDPAITQSRACAATGHWQQGQVHRSIEPKAI